MTIDDVYDRLAAGFPHTKVAIACRISLGAFSSERIFAIETVDGEHVGVCDTMYVNDQTPEKFKFIDEAPAIDEPRYESRLVCARLLDVIEDRVKVVVPGNDVVTVRADEVQKRWEGAP